MPGRRPWQRDMQPARKLLSLLFLILMGTELTQVRAFNAIFLSASDGARGRPARGAGEVRERLARSSAPGWGGGPERGAPALEGGARADPSLPRAPTSGTPALAGVAVGCPLSARTPSLLLP